MAKSFPNTGATVGLAADRTAMAGMLEGQEFFETDTNKMFVYSGTTWVQTNSWSTTAGVTSVSTQLIPPMVVIRRAASQSIANNSVVSVSFDTEDVDTDNCFTATSTNITIQTAGVYLLIGTVLFDTNASGGREVGFVKNGTTINASGGAMVSAGIPNVGFSFSLTSSGITSLQAADVITLYAYQSCGSALGAVARCQLVWLVRAS